jgi:PHD/YefM family antitoxin component YafN of YafNO toxin-antitoxin module
MSKRINKEPEVIVRDGKPVSVILPIKEYEELLERLEDAEDVAYLKKLRSKPLSFRPLSEYLAERSKANV